MISSDETKFSSADPIFLSDEPMILSDVPMISSDAPMISTDNPMISSAVQRKSSEIGHFLQKRIINSPVCSYRIRLHLVNTLPIRPLLF